MEKIHIDDLVGPERNYRSRIDQEKLANLADSIRDRGILQNLLVVRIAEQDGKFRVVAGERRFRALPLAIEKLRLLLAAADLRGETKEVQRIAEWIAELQRVPVRILTDEEAAEAEFLQLVENLQREEVPLADEIRVISSWVDRGMEIPVIADKLGVDREWVRRRNQLSLCPVPLMRALEEGMVTQRVALLVCTVPDRARREEFASRVLNPITQLTPLDERQARAILEAEYMLPLSLAPWPAITVYAGMRPCSGCPSRREMKTGAMCLDAPCYGRKAEEAFFRLAEEAGAPWIYGEMTPEIFDGPGGKVNPAVDWLDLAEEVPAREVGHYGEVKWRKWIEDELGQKVEEVAKVYLALHPVTYQVRYLVGKSAIRLLLKEAARIKGPAEAAGAEGEDHGAQCAEVAGDEDLADDDNGETGPVMVPGSLPETLSVEDATIYRSLFEATVRAEEDNLDPLATPRFLRRLLGALLLRMRPAEARQWAETVGIALDGDGARTAVHHVSQAHPRLLPGMLAVACTIGRPGDASAAEGELSAALVV